MYHFHKYHSNIKNMSKSLKFKNNNYLDSSSIVHNRELLSEILKDTGWVNLEVEENFNNLSWEPLAYRKIGNIVFIHGGGTLDYSTSNVICSLPNNILPRQNIQTVCPHNASSNYSNILIDNIGIIKQLTSTNSSTSVTIIFNICYVAR